MVGIINYGIGNLGSVLNMFKKVGVQAELFSTSSEISKYSHLVLPGVGHFDSCMKAFNKSGLREIVEKKVIAENQPILGICVGFQMMTKCSEEGSEKGLGWFNAQTRAFAGREAFKDSVLKVPHMGWNYVKSVSESPLTGSLPTPSRFYFVHSYFVQTEDPFLSLLKCKYGLEFDAGLRQKSIYGVQFHAEKSHRYGMAVFKNFSEL